MTLLTVESAVLDVIRQIPGIGAAILGPPLTVQIQNLAYLVASSGERNPSPVMSKVVMNRYHLTLTVAVPSQDNPAAEAQISGFIDAIQLAMRQAFWDRRISFWVARWETDTRIIGGENNDAAALFRVVDFSIDASEEDAF